MRSCLVTTVSSSRSVGTAALDPRLIQRLVVVGWWFCAFAALSAVAFSIMTVSLPSNTWYSIIVGKVAGGGAANLVPTLALVVGSWILVVVCVAIVVIVRVFGTPSRPGLLVLLIVGIALSATPFASLLASVIPQLGSAAPITLAQAIASVVPAATVAGVVGTIAAIAAIVTVAVRSSGARPAQHPAARKTR